MKSLGILLFVLHIGAYLAERTGKELPCQLTWTLAELPVTEIPADFVKLQKTGNENQYIIRGKFDGDDKLVVGRYDNSEDVKKMLLPFFGDKDENSTFGASFEFLTNPHECSIDWAEKLTTGEEKFLVSNQGKGSNDVVGGRLDSSSRRWYPGHVDQKSGKIYIATEEGFDGSEEFTNFFLLLAYSNGLEMDVVDFDFASDPFGGETDFAGMDEIHNNGPGEVSVTLNHKKTIKETYEIVITKTYTYTRTETIRTRILFWSKTRTSTYTYTDTSVETYTNVEENEFAVSQQLTVPAYTSVQACSLIKLTENKVIDYTAAVIYSAKGMDPEDIVELLKGENIEAEVLNGEVRGKERMKGTFKASTALNTEFVVVEYGAGMQGCTAKSLQSRPWKKLLTN